MEKGTKIHYRGSEYNKDGDRPVNFDSVPSITSENLQSAMDDPELHFMQITKDKIFGIDKLHFKEHKFLLLEPNPVTFYFSLAFDAVNQIEQAKNNLENILKFNIEDKGKAQAFSFVFKVASVIIIFSFLGLEAFLNQMLPDQGMIEYKSKKLSKNQVERYVPFMDKLKLIIPSLTGKYFCENHPTNFSDIELLKTLRDELTHLKEVSNGLTSYNKVYQDILNADLKSIVSSVKAFINFYSPGLIENYKMKTMIK